MTQQLVLSINASADSLHWCWLEQGKPVQEQQGDWDSLRALLQERPTLENPQAWLLVPGAKVGVREMAYSEKEKKHLRNLLPYQLEESVVGDIDDLHIALGEPVKGKVSLAYVERDWLKTVFSQFESIGIEITRCWAKPLVLPLESAEKIEPSLLTDVEVTREVSVDAAKLAEGDNEEKIFVASALATWVVALENNQAHIRYSEQAGFSVPLLYLQSALSKLREQLNWKDRLPHLVLRTETDSDMTRLRESLPEYQQQITDEQVASRWVLDFDGRAINLCQAEFSQRLPLERWWKLWRNLVIFAVVALVIYVGVAAFQIYKLKKQNLILRQQMEQVYRDVVPHGQSDDPEKRLRIKLNELQPKTTTGSFMALVGGVFPTVAGNSDVSIKVISYSADSGEMTMNVQAHSFAAIDALRQNLASQGFNAELMNANAQGDLNSGRLKISKPGL